MINEKHFMGRDGFYWFIGKVVDRNDTKQLGRVRVRVFGLHPDDEKLVPNDHLPWAIPVQPVTSAGIFGVGQSPTGLLVGSYVFGFFADGQDAQIPIIIGSIASSLGHYVYQAIDNITTAVKDAVEPLLDQGESAGTGPGYHPVNTANAKGSWAKDTEFVNGVNILARKYNIDANDLLGLMASESGNNLDPSATNKQGGATGLIQFLPSVAEKFGTTTTALRGMTRTQQLGYVDKYFSYWKLPQGATAGQLYCVVFLPAYAKKPSNFVIARANGANDAGQGNPKWYSQNSGLDVNHNGEITIADLGVQVSRKRQQLGLGPSAKG